MASYRNISTRVLGLLVSEVGSIAMVFKKTGPEPDHWDLPGGGIKPGETLVNALVREIQEETGLHSYQYSIGRILTIAEGFFPDWGENGLHSLSVIYRCSVIGEPPLCPREADTAEAKWFLPAQLNLEQCSKRSRFALNKAGLHPTQLRKETFVWLFNKMSDIARVTDLEMQLMDTWAHSLQVWAVATRLIEQILPHQPDLNVDLIEFACFAHDLGRMVTGSAASEVRDPNHGFSHGPIGAAIMRRPNFLSGLKYNMPAFERYPRGSGLQDALARVCERHTGCVGISQRNWPSQLKDENGNCLDYQPDPWDTVVNIKGCFVGTWEEKVVGIADFLTTAHPVYPSGDRDSSVFYKGMSTHIDERIKKAEKKGFDTTPIIRRLKERFDQEFKIDWNYIVGIEQLDKDGL